MPLWLEILVYLSSVAAVVLTGMAAGVGVSRMYGWIKRRPNKNPWSRVSEKCSVSGCSMEKFLDSGKCVKHYFEALNATPAVSSVRRHTYLGKTDPSEDSNENEQKLIQLLDRFMGWAPHLSGCSTEQEDECDCGWSDMNEDWQALKKELTPSAGKGFAYVIDESAPFSEARIVKNS
jgi:hypothetical protein